MTLINLFKHHGHNVAPFVAPDGHIHFHDVTAAAATAMAVKPHTFHGGEDPVDSAVEGWWNAPGALDADREAVQQFFPGFVEVPLDSSPPAWIGTLDTGQGKFTIAVQHRRDHGLPSVVPLNPLRRQRAAAGRMEKSPHLFTSGNLCVAAQDDWDPASDTVATVIGWAAHWHAAYAVWLVTLRWPSEGYVRDAA